MKIASLPKDMAMSTAQSIYLDIKELIDNEPGARKLYNLIVRNATSGSSNSGRLATLANWIGVLFLNAGEQHNGLNPYWMEPRETLKLLRQMFKDGDAHFDSVAIIALSHPDGKHRESAEEYLSLVLDGQEGRHDTLIARAKEDMERRKKHMSNAAMLALLDEEEDQSKKKEEAEKVKRNPAARKPVRIAELTPVPAHTQAGEVETQNGQKSE